MGALRVTGGLRITAEGRRGEPLLAGALPVRFFIYNLRKEDEYAKEYDRLWKR